jgi:phenylalanyl-tRNA synthetase beta chain
VIVSQITASSRHPNADRLTVCEVDDGSGTKRQIVCGATNYKVGDKVPLALPGAKLPNGTEIRKSKLRGVESEGMLCSPIELGLGEDASGLLILSPDAKVGAPIAIFSRGYDSGRRDHAKPRRFAEPFRSCPRNRGLTGATLTLAPAKAGAGRARLHHRCGNQRMSSSLAAQDRQRKSGPSPQWLRAKIESVGVRSINIIVDISNFVMLELGQPTHAFRRRQN